MVAVRLNETMVKWLDGFGFLDGVWVIGIRAKWVDMMVMAVGLCNG